MLLEYNYLTSPEKLMEYHRLYFDDNLVPLKINDLKEIEFNKNKFLYELDQEMIKGKFYNSDNPYDDFTNIFKTVTNKHALIKQKKVRFLFTI